MQAISRRFQAASVVSSRRPQPLTSQELVVKLQAAQRTQREKIRISFELELSHRQNGIASSRMGQTDDLAGTHNYVPGEDSHRIDWRTSGRTEKLQVRENFDQAEATAGMALDFRNLDTPEAQAKWVNDFINSTKAMFKNKGSPSNLKLQQLFLLLPRGYQGKIRFDLEKLTLPGKITYEQLMGKILIPLIQAKYPGIAAQLARQTQFQLTARGYYTDDQNADYLKRQEAMLDYGVTEEKQLAEQLGRVARQIKVDNMFFVGTDAISHNALVNVLGKQKLGWVWEGRVAYPARRVAAPSDAALLADAVIRPVEEEKMNSSLGTKAPGGIDLNPNKINLEIKDQGKETVIPNAVQEDWAHIQFNGLVPEIINVSPLNIPLFLGESQPSTEENSQLSRFR